MFCACACAWQACAGQRPLAPPVFRVYGTEQGLPSRQIQALAQDHDGRLWVGTAAGLVRFDGHAFVAYPARPEHSQALASTSVEAMTVSADGRVWVGTQGGQLAVWRQASDDFERIELAAQSDGQLEVWSLVARGDRLWVGTYGAGLLELDLTGRLQRQHRLPDSARHLTEVLAPADGSLWLVTMDHQLLRFDPDTSTVASLLMAPGATALAVYGTALRGEALWFTTRDGQQCSVTADRIPHCAAIPLLALPGRAHMLLPDARGDWIGGSGEALRVVDGQPQRIAFDPGSIGGVPQQSLWTALRDRDGGLWFGSTGGGLLHLGADADRFQAWQPSVTGRSGLRDGRVRGAAHGDDDRVYFATLNGGLHRLDVRSGAIEALELPGTAQRRVWSVLRDGPDRLWVGYQDGLMRLAVMADGELRLQQHWSAAQLVGPMIDLLHHDADGQVWAASMGAGLNRIDPVDGAVTQYAFAANGLAGTEVQQIGNGLDGRIWAATDDGMHAFEPDCGCWRALIASGRVDAWVSSEPGRVDAFVDGQLVRYRWRDGLFRDGTVAPRAFREFQTVGSMQRDGASLWLAGPQGLHRLAPDHEHPETFGARDGLPTSEFSDRPMHVDTRGRMWIGSEDGLVSLDPAEVTPLPAPPRLRFEQLQVTGPGGLRDLLSTRRGSLQPDDRDLHAVVRLVSLARPHAQRFSFRVSGWDTDWSPPSALPERRLEALPHGSYTLEVRAWDGHGQAAANTLAWRFLVLPPWWRATPALVVYALLGAGLLALLAIWRRRRQHAAALLLETRRQAQWAERLAAEQSALVAELSHEIRNPLNGALGMGRLLAGMPLAVDAQRYVDLLLDAGRQLTRLLDDMLDWSRLDARSEALPLQPVRLLPELAATLARHQQQAHERNLTFTALIDAGLVAQADPARLMQIVDNLVGNAIKFTPRGSIEVQAHAAAGRIQIRVCDSGPGLTPEQVARLFQPFERVGDQRAAPGTGLGLAISRRLAERMGGELRVESEPGVGSCFVLVLAPATMAEPTLPLAPAAAPDRERALIGRSLLVVDDDAIGRELLERELGACGAAVRSVPEALSALILLQQHAFDAALIDWDLPGMNGVDLARTLRVQQPALALIAVTGRTTPADQALAIDVGFAAHVAKPVDPDRLAATVVRVLAGGPPAVVGADLGGRS